jgi:hypothetical protein
MHSPIIVKGHLTGRRNVELEEPVTNVMAEVEVIVRAADGASDEQTQSVFQFLRGLPPGTQTREELDRRIQEDCKSWDGFKTR